MSADAPPEGQPSPSLSVPDTPGQFSADLQSLLGLAAIASLISAALEGASTLLTINRGFQDGFTLSLALSLAAILPQLVIAATLYSLGEESQSKAVTVAGTSVYLCSCLIELLGLCLEDFLPTWAKILVGILVVVGMISVGGIVAESYKGLKEFGGALALGAFFLFRAVMKVLGKKIGLDFGSGFILVAGGLLLLAVAVFMLWFSLLLIAQHRKFGLLGAIVGVVQITTFALVVAAGVRFINEMFQLLEQPNMTEELFGKEVEKRALDLMPTALLAETLPAVLTAVWFFALRLRGGQAPLTGEGG